MFREAIIISVTLIALGVRDTLYKALFPGRRKKVPLSSLPREGNILPKFVCGNDEQVRRLKRTSTSSRNTGMAMWTKTSPQKWSYQAHKKGWRERKWISLVTLVFAVTSLGIEHLHSDLEGLDRGSSSGNAETACRPRTSRTLGGL